MVLTIVDALICQYQGEQRSLLHYSTPLNEIWFSKDPVAIDVMAIEELDRQKAIAKMPAGRTRLDLYQNAALLELGVADSREIRVEPIGK